MENGARTPERLERMLEDAATEYPHNRDIIVAFRPLLVERRRLVESLPSAEDACALDEALYASGTPLMQQTDLLGNVDWDHLALSLIPPLSEGFATIKDDLKNLDAFLAAHAGSLNALMSRPVSERQAAIAQLAAQAQVDPQVLGFVFENATRIILENRDRAWAALLEGFAWDKGYCPICGGSPMLARIEEGIPRRRLYCSRCGHAWQFSRVICPACGNDDQKTMTYYSVEDASQQSTFACEHCKHYLVTVNKITELADFDPDVSALSLVHLDVLMQEKGYHPMAHSAWNDLS